MKTYTGREVDPLFLRVEDIDILDIAHHLSNICRFGGATAWHYSVAQHSVYVAQQCAGLGDKFQALLHDAAEAYLGDMPSPIKYHAAMIRYREIEKEAQQTIYRRFGVLTDEESNRRVKEADQRMLVTEGVYLMNHRYTFAENSDRMFIERWTPRYAEKEFLRCYQDIIGAPFFSGKS